MVALSALQQVNGTEGLGPPAGHTGGRCPIPAEKPWHRDSWHQEPMEGCNGAGKALLLTTLSQPDQMEILFLERMNSLQKGFQVKMHIWEVAGMDAMRLMRTLE